MSHQKQNQNKNKHTPVLLPEVLHYLNPHAGETYLDATAGYGGHAQAILARTKYAHSVLVDRDQQAIEQLQQLFAGKDTTLRQQDFATASQQLLNNGQRFDLILADVGVSSPHLNNASRGFAINQSGPLDMRMDQRQELTANTIVNSYSEAQLTDLIHRYGEEPRAKRLAHAIVTQRPITSTTQLAEVIKGAKKRSKSRVHPATKTFQALRIAVNEELRLLETALPLWIQLLNPGGRLVVISFHSLEDRLVKDAFKAVSGNRYDATLKLLTKRPVTASREEIVFNPRARSAKLRAAVKINI